MIDNEPKRKPGGWLRKSQDQSLDVAEQAELEVREGNSAVTAKTEWIKRGFWAAVTLILGGVAATLVT